MFEHDSNVHVSSSIVYFKTSRNEQDYPYINA